MTGKQLKNSILQWAIQGKLVPQDPNDEPASVLLEKIRAEKARLIKEGKIKKDKKESIIYRGEDNSYYEKFTDGKVVCIDDEIPFEIPSGWEWCRISDLATIVGGYAYKSYDFISSSRNQVLRLGNIKNDYLKLEASPVYISDDLAIKTDKFRCHLDDILVTMTGTRKKRDYFFSYKVKSINHNCFINQRVGAIRFYIQELSNYMIYALKAESILHDVFQYETGTANQGNLGSENIAKVLIPLPPLAEQYRIVDKIQELLPVVKLYDSVQSKLDSLNKEIKPLLRKSILQEAIQGRLVMQDPNDEPASVLLQRIKEEKLRLVAEGKLKKKDVIDSTIFRGDDNKYYEQTGSEITCIDNIVPFDLPASWCWVRHNQLFEVSGGSQPPKSHFIDHYKEGYIRLYQIRDYGSNPVPVYVPKDEISKTTRKGDILLARYGGSLGKVFWAEEGAYNVAMAKVIPLYKSDSIYNEYIFLYYCSSIYQSTIIDHSRSAQAGFNKDDLADMLFPLPPFAEQARIVERYKSIVASMMSR